MAQFHIKQQLAADPNANIELNWTEQNKAGGAQGVPEDDYEYAVEELLEELGQDNVDNELQNVDKETGRSVVYNQPQNSSGLSNQMKKNPKAREAVFDTLGKEVSVHQKAQKAEFEGIMRRGEEVAVPSASTYQVKVPGANHEKDYDTPAKAVTAVNDLLGISQKFYDQFEKDFSKKVGGAHIMGNPFKPFHPPPPNKDQQPGPSTGNNLID